MKLKTATGGVHRIQQYGQKEEITEGSVVDTAWCWCGKTLSGTVVADVATTTCKICKDKEK